MQKLKKYLQMSFVAYVAAHTLLLLEAIKVFMIDRSIPDNPDASQWIFTGGIFEAFAMTTVFYILARYARAKVSVRELFLSAIFAQLFYSYVYGSLEEKFLPLWSAQGSVAAEAKFIVLYVVLLVIGRAVFPNGLMPLFGKREIFSEAQVRFFFDRLMRLFIVGLAFMSFVIAFLWLPEAFGWQAMNMQPGYMLLTVQFLALQFGLIILFLMLFMRPSLLQNVHFTAGAGSAAMWALVIGIIPINIIAFKMPNPQLATIVFIAAAAFTMYGGLIAYASRKGV